MILFVPWRFVDVMELLFEELLRIASLGAFFLRIGTSTEAKKDSRAGEGEQACLSFISDWNVRRWVCLCCSDKEQDSVSPGYPPPPTRLVRNLSCVVKWCGMTSREAETEF